MIQIAMETTAVNQIKLSGERFDGNMLVTLKADGTTLSASSDYISLVGDILERTYDNKSEDGEYVRWENANAREIWAVQQYLLYRSE